VNVTAALVCRPVQYVSAKSQSYASPPSRKCTRYNQETAPHEIGEAISAFVRGLRGDAT
jgi:hypothetical protein